MGYNTRFTLESVKGDSADVFWSDFEVDDVVTGGGLSLKSIFYDGKNSDELKWYEWREDLKAISFEYPNTLFTLSGIGEDPEDLWVAYARNGKVQVAEARITFEEVSNEILTNSPTLQQVEEFEKHKRKIELRQQRAEIDRQLEELR